MLKYSENSELSSTRYCSIAEHGTHPSLAFLYIKCKVTYGVLPIQIGKVVLFKFFLSFAMILSA